MICFIFSNQKLAYVFRDRARMFRYREREREREREEFNCFEEKFVSKDFVS